MPFEAAELMVEEDAEVVEGAGVFDGSSTVGVSTVTDTVVVVLPVGSAVVSAEAVVDGGGLFLVHSNFAEEDEM